MPIPNRTRGFTGHSVSKLYRPAELLRELSALSKTGAVVIGGQAVNIWAERYAKNEPFWSVRQPYTSRDLDVLGSQLDVLTYSKEMDAQPLNRDR